MKTATKKEKKSGLVLKGATVLNPKLGNGYKVEIGCLDANFSDDMLKDIHLQKALFKIGKQLCAQLKCDAIDFHAISFQRWWKPEEKK